MKKNGEEKLNKSRVCRDFWRKVFADDLCNLRNSDERKEIVDQFFADPANKGWNRTKDKRFMRSAFAKVAKENNFNIMQLGITPTPSRSKTQKGSTQFNVKSKEKLVPPTESVAPTQEQLKNDKGKLNIPNQQQISQGQLSEASAYTSQSVGQMIAVPLNMIFSRLGASPLTQQEIVALGESWLPVANMYLTGNSIFVMPVLITIPILLQRFAEVKLKKKETEIKERYKQDPEPQTEPVEKPTESKWSNLSHGQN